MAVLPDVGEVKSCRRRKDVLEVFGSWLLKAMEGWARKICPTKNEHRRNNNFRCKFFNDQLELPPHGCLPPPTTQASVCFHVCPDSHNTYSEDVLSHCLSVKWRLLYNFQWLALFTSLSDSDCSWTITSKFILRLCLVQRLCQIKDQCCDWAPIGARLLTIGANVSKHISEHSSGGILQKKRLYITSFHVKTREYLI